MGPADFHLRELEIARSAADPRHVMPPPVPGCRRILDIGCGAGQTLIVADMGAARKVGIDCDFEALRLGKQLSSEIDFVLAMGEALPFLDNTFDRVISRVALPYMHIPTVIGETARVLASEGSVWFVLHPLSRLQAVFHSPRQMVIQTYVAMNSLLFHFSGLLVHFPFRRDKIESVQTRAGIRRCLRSCGFGEIEFPSGSKFVVTARKNDPPLIVLGNSPVSGF